TYFVWPMPNDEKRVEPKVVYSKKDPNWGWVVNAGTYMMDFNAPAKDILNSLLIISALTLVIGIRVIWLFASSIADPLKKASEKMNGLAEGNLRLEPMRVRSNDELGQLATAMNHIHEQLRAVIENISSSSVLFQSQSEDLSHSASEVKTGTQQVSVTKQELASGSESQAIHSSNLSPSINEFHQKLE